MNVRARLRSSRQGGQAATPDNLIHRNKSPNPALARVTARFDFENGGSPSLLKSVMQLPLPLALELLRRQAK